MVAVPWVRTKLNPDELIFVSEAAHADLADKGLLLGQWGGDVPPDPDDTRLARYLRESSSATRAELQVLLGELVGAEVAAAAAGVRDPLVAALIAASGSETRVQLEAASVAAVLESPKVARRAGGNMGIPAARVVVLGDSIENLNSFINNGPTSFSRQFGKDWPTFAMLRSDGKFQLIHNAGVGGESTSDYLLRWDADVVPHAPTMVVIGGAENDIQEAATLPAIRANLEQLVALTYGIGATPVLRTTMPHHLSNAVRQKIGAFNHWVRDYCARNGIPCLDFWEVLVDHTTGQYQAAYTTDGVHPNEAGSDLLGTYAANVLTPLIPPLRLSLAGDPTDTGLLAPNPYFATDTSGTPNTWNAIGGTPTGVTRSMVTDPQVPGRMARLAAVASAAAVSIASNSSIIDTDVAGPGDILEVTGLFTSDGGVTVSTNFTINYNDGAVKNIARVPVSAIKRPFTRAMYRTRLPALPVGFQNVIISLGIGAGTGQADFAYPAVRNLTREGIV